jgi:N utilization substance protein B
MKNRRKSRELALQTMYAHEMGADESLARILDTIADNQFASEDARRYARKIIEYVESRREPIDVMLSRHTKNWDLKRMAAVERNVLRLAVTELAYIREAPHKVIIDEAVEIAKTYGSPESGKFVNGIIDAIYKELSANSAGKEFSDHGSD